MDMKTTILTMACVLTTLTVNSQTWKHYHSGSGFDSEATNMWVTNGGSCRTAVTVDGVTKDCTLEVMIDNDSKQYKENEFSTIKNAMVRSPQPDGHSDLVGVPVEFTVTGDESIVDHYELCGYNHLTNSSYPIMTTTDTQWYGDLDLLEATNNPTNTMRIEKENTPGPHRYKCFVVDPIHPTAEYVDRKGNLYTGPRYSVVPIYEADAISGDIVLSIYIKVYYNNGLEPTYHSMNNVKYSIQKLPTGVEDIEEADQKAVYYNLNGMVVDRPEQGIFIKKQGNKVSKVII